MSSPPSNRFLPAVRSASMATTREIARAFQESARPTRFDLAIAEQTRRDMAIMDGETAKTIWGIEQTGRVHDFAAVRMQQTLSSFADSRYVAGRWPDGQPVMDQFLQALAVSAGTNILTLTGIGQVAIARAAARPFDIDHLSSEEPGFVQRLFGRA